MPGFGGSTTSRRSKSSRSMSTATGGFAAASLALSAAFGVPDRSRTGSSSLRASSGDGTLRRSGTAAITCGFVYTHELSIALYTGVKLRSVSR